MTEVDNVCFLLALDERTRSRVEEEGRVRLTEKEAAALSMMKRTHVVLVIGSCLLVVRLAGSTLAMKDSSFSGGDPSELLKASMLVVPVGYWIGGVLEASGAGLSPKDLALHIGRVTFVRISSLMLGAFILNTFIPSGGGNQSFEPDGSWG